MTLVADLLKHSTKYEKKENINSRRNGGLFSEIPQRAVYQTDCLSDRLCQTKEAPDDECCLEAADRSLLAEREYIHCYVYYAFSASSQYNDTPVHLISC
jgi:hypothetical protein